MGVQVDNSERSTGGSGSSRKPGAAGWVNSACPVPEKLQAEGEAQSHSVLEQRMVSSTLLIIF
jgi:hypothetical protein